MARAGYHLDALMTRSVNKFAASLNKDFAFNC